MSLLFQSTSNIQYLVVLHFFCLIYLCTPSYVLKKKTKCFIENATTVAEMSSYMGNIGRKKILKICSPDYKKIQIFNILFE